MRFWCRRNTLWPTFWNNKAPLQSRRCASFRYPLGLLTVAALLPAAWTCRLVDRNVADVTEADLRLGRSWSRQGA